MDWNQAISNTAAAVSAIGAIWAARVAVSAYRAQLSPDVIVFVRHDDSRPSVLQIIIENIGRGVATDVRFAASRPIPAKAWGFNDDPPREVIAMTAGPLVNGIPLLAPGQRRVITWGQFGGLRRALGSEPLSLRCEYRHGRKKMPLAEFLLEIDSFETTDAVASESQRAVEELKHTAEALQKISRSLEARRRRVTRSGTTPQSTPEGTASDRKAE